MTILSALDILCARIESAQDKIQAGLLAGDPITARAHYTQAHTELQRALYDLDFQRANRRLRKTLTELQTKIKRKHT